jgi:hypothetical protein
LTAADTDELMNKFKIKVARIEAATGSRVDSRVCITFSIDRGTVSFRVPIDLSVRDFDDTEMVQAARSALHLTFVELAAQTSHSKLSAKELGLLSGMSLRAKK